jgi:hypothetical protein
MRTSLCDLTGFTLDRQVARACKRDSLYFTCANSHVRNGRPAIRAMKVRVDEASSKKLTRCRAGAFLLCSFRVPRGTDRIHGQA